MDNKNTTLLKIIYFQLRNDKILENLSTPDCRVGINLRVKPNSMFNRICVNIKPYSRTHVYVNKGNIEIWDKIEASGYIKINIQNNKENLIEKIVEVILEDYKKCVKIKH